MNSRVSIRILLLISCLVSLSVTSRAQKSVADLKPTHAAALEKFIRRRPHLEFLSEREIDQEILKDMRKNFDARLTPFYRIGDFNHDGIQDFAIILATEGAPAEDSGLDLAESHRYRHELSVVIFNGQKKGGYRLAFEKKVTTPLVCFLYETFEKRKKLYFAVYETDEHFIMAPAGVGYLVEYEH